MTQTTASRSETAARLRALADGSAADVRGAFGDLLSASAIERRAELVQDAIASIPPAPITAAAIAAYIPTSAHDHEYTETEDAGYDARASVEEDLQDAIAAAYTHRAHYAELLRAGFTKPDAQDGANDESGLAGALARAHDAILLLAAAIEHPPTDSDDDPPPSAAPAPTYSQLEFSDAYLRERAAAGIEVVQREQPSSANLDCAARLRALTDGSAADVRGALDTLDSVTAIQRRAALVQDAIASIPTAAVDARRLVRDRLHDAECAARDYAALYSDFRRDGYGKNHAAQFAATESGAHDARCAARDAILQLAAAIEQPPQSPTPEPTDGAPIPHSAAVEFAEWGLSYDDEARRSEQPQPQPEQQQQSNGANLDCAARLRSLSDGSAADVRGALRSLRSASAIERRRVLIADACADIPPIHLPTNAHNQIQLTGWRTIETCAQDIINDRLLTAVYIARTNETRSEKRLATQQADEALTLLCAAIEQPPQSPTPEPTDGATVAGAIAEARRIEQAHDAGTKRLAARNDAACAVCGASVPREQENIAPFRRRCEECRIARRLPQPPPRDDRAARRAYLETPPQSQQPATTRDDPPQSRPFPDLTCPECQSANIGRGAYTGDPFCRDCSSDAVAGPDGVWQGVTRQLAAELRGARRPRIERPYVDAEAVAIEDDDEYIPDNEPPSDDAPPSSYAEHVRSSDRAAPPQSSDPTPSARAYRRAKQARDRALDDFRAAKGASTAERDRARAAVAQTSRDVDDAREQVISDDAALLCPACLALQFIVYRPCVPGHEREAAEYAPQPQPAQQQQTKPTDNIERIARAMEREHDAQQEWGAALSEHEDSPYDVWRAETKPKRAAAERAAAHRLRLQTAASEAEYVAAGRIADARITQREQEDRAARLSEPPQRRPQSRAACEWYAAGIPRNLRHISDAYGERTIPDVRYRPSPHNVPRSASIVDYRLRRMHEQHAIDAAESGAGDDAGNGAIAPQPQPAQQQQSRPAPAADALPAAQRDALELMGEQAARIEHARAIAWQTYTAALAGETLTVEPRGAYQTAGWIDQHLRDAAACLRSAARAADPHGYPRPLTPYLRRMQELYELATCGATVQQQPLQQQQARRRPEPIHPYNPNDPQDAALNAAVQDAHAEYRAANDQIAEWRAQGDSRADSEYSPMVPHARERLRAALKAHADYIPPQPPAPRDADRPAPVANDGAPVGANAANSAAESRAAQSPVASPTASIAPNPPNSARSARITR